MVRRIDERVGLAAFDAAIAAERAGEGVPRAVLATAVRWSLQVLADEHPGHAVEVRVPPYGAVQCIAGPRHTRGTPPNVIETDAVTWLGLASGRVRWADALAAGAIDASGVRAHLDGMLPVPGLRR